MGACGGSWAAGAADPCSSVGAPPLLAAAGAVVYGAARSVVGRASQASRPARATDELMPQPVRAP